MTVQYQNWPPGLGFIRRSLAVGDGKPWLPWRPGFPASWYYNLKGESLLNLALMRLIDEQFLLIPYYGSRQMMRHLQRQGYCIGRHRVRRLMRIMGLRAIYQEPRTSIPHPEHKVYPLTFCAPLPLPGPIRSGVLTSPTFPSNGGFFIWWRSWTGIAVKC